MLCPLCMLGSRFITSRSTFKGSIFIIFCYGDERCQSDRSDLLKILWDTNTYPIIEIPFYLISCRDSLVQVKGLVGYVRIFLETCQRHVGFSYKRTLIYHKTRRDFLRGSYLISLLYFKSKLRIEQAVKITITIQSLIRPYVNFFGHSVSLTQSEIPIPGRDINYLKINLYIFIFYFLFFIF